MSNWAIMNVADRIQAIKDVYIPGMTYGGAVRRIEGLTKVALVAFYARNRDSLQGFEMGLRKTRVFTEQERADARRLVERGVPLVDAAEIVGANVEDIRAITGQKKEGVRSSERRDIYERGIRITDHHDSLTAALCGDPTPMRRQLMQEGRL